MLIACKTISLNKNNSKHFQKFAYMLADSSTSVHAVYKPVDMKLRNTELTQ